MNAKSYFVLDSIKPLKELIEGIKPIVINMFSINMDLKDGEGALVLMDFQAGDPGLESPAGPSLIYLPYRAF